MIADCRRVAVAVIALGRGAMVAHDRDARIAPRAGFPEPLDAGPSPLAYDPLGIGVRRRARMFRLWRRARWPQAGAERHEILAQLGAHDERLLAQILAVI